MSKEYIEREAALSDEMCEGISCQECPFLIHPVNGGCKVVKYINGIPAADVVEVKHGEWEEVEIEDSEDVVNPPNLVTMRCNKCNRYHTTIYFYGNPTEMMHYCPNCGAKMDGGVSDAAD